MAIFGACRNFEACLYGRPFTLQTDHAPLVHSANTDLNAHMKVQFSQACSISGPSILRDGAAAWWNCRVAVPLAEVKRHRSSYGEHKAQARRIATTNGSRCFSAGHIYSTFRFFLCFMILILILTPLFAAIYAFFINVVMYINPFKH